MKRAFLPAMLLTVVSLACCTKESAENTPATGSQTKGEVFTITASNPSNGSRVTVGSDGLTLNWAAADVLTIFQSVPAGTNGVNFTTTAPAVKAFSIVDAATYTPAPTATFSGELSATDFPAAATAGRLFFAVCTGSGVTLGTGPLATAQSNSPGCNSQIDLPLTQTVNIGEDGKTLSSDIEKYFILWAEPKNFDNVAIVDNDLGDFTFHLLTTILDFNIQNIPDGYKINSVVIADQTSTTPVGTACAFIMRVNVSAKSFRGQADGEDKFLFGTTAAGQFANQATCQLATPVTGTGTNSITASLALFPRDAMYDQTSTANKQNAGKDARNLKITVACTDPGGASNSWTFVKNSVNTGAWAAGVRTPFALNLSGKTLDN